MVKFTSLKHPKVIIVLNADHVHVVSKRKNYETTSHEEVMLYD